jgi:hypothetical protein
MHYICTELDKFDDFSNPDNTPEAYYETDPRLVIAQGYEELKKEAIECKLLGSTTVLLALLRVGNSFF